MFLTSIAVYLKVAAKGSLIKIKDTRLKEKVIGERSNYVPGNSGFVFKIWGE